MNLYKFPSSLGIQIFAIPVLVSTTAHLFVVAFFETSCQSLISQSTHVISHSTLV